LAINIKNGEVGGWGFGKWRWWQNQVTESIRFSQQNQCRIPGGFIPIKEQNSPLSLYFSQKSSETIIPVEVQGFFRGENVYFFTCFAYIKLKTDTKKS